MKQTIEFNTTKTIASLLENDRNFYQTAVNKAYKALKNGQTVQFTCEPEVTGWCFVFVTINATEYQFSKKRIRTSDLQYIFGSN